MKFNEKLVNLRKKHKLEMKEEINSGNGMDLKIM